MSSENHTPWQLMSELERRSLLPLVCGRLRDFMLAASRLLGPFLPPAAEEWLQVAERYRHMQASVAELKRVRVAAWEFLGDTYNFQLPGVLAVRAVICLLFPDDYEDGKEWFEIVHFFLDVSNRAADHRREQCKLLQQLFPEYFGDEGRG
jgi:hypothetical protein